MDYLIDNAGTVGIYAASGSAAFYLLWVIVKGIKKAISFLFDVPNMMDGEKAGFSLLFGPLAVSPVTIGGIADTAMGKGLKGGIITSIVLVSIFLLICGGARISDSERNKG